MAGTLAISLKSASSGRFEFPVLPFHLMVQF